MAKRGILISFEGGEGGGKSTQIRRLAQGLKRRGLKVLVTLEPGGSRIGKKVRELLLNPRNRELHERAELLLYMADRAQHTEEILLPALAEGKVVITDRFRESSTVYQGFCRGMGVDWAEELNDFATAKLKSDIVLVLDVPVSIGFSRVQNRIRHDQKLKGKRKAVKMDRLEREKRAFHEKVRKGFLQLAKKEPRRIFVIDSTASQDDVAGTIAALVGRKLGRALHD